MLNKTKGTSFAVEWARWGLSASASKMNLPRVRSGNTLYNGISHMQIHTNDNRKSTDKNQFISSFIRFVDRLIDVNNWSST